MFMYFNIEINILD